MLNDHEKFCRMNKVLNSLGITKAADRSREQSRHEKRMEQIETEYEQRRHRAILKIEGQAALDEEIERQRLVNGLREIADDFCSSPKELRKAVRALLKPVKS